MIVGWIALFVAGMVITTHYVRSCARGAWGGWAEHMIAALVGSIGIIMATGGLWGIFTN